MNYEDSILGVNWVITNFAHDKSAHYKEYLTEEVCTDKGRPLAFVQHKCSRKGALKSFFHWLRDTYPDIIEVNPMAGVKFEKLPLKSAQDECAI